MQVAQFCIPDIECTALSRQGSVSSIQLVMATSLVVGCGAVSVALWYFSRRYLGEIALVGPLDRPALCFSVLDFWGNREVRQPAQLIITLLYSVHTW